ncbi:hypothetical protein SISNIDRAFT_487471 [Sistotremastrum niveocremeum HHB9708]|uniref:Uncharacterized protein n=1 Tax=Sistotremastrum niveocremeum HHB9708 TaxID=1314777 RepID=A0A164SHZ1_9AGAM|nr:hypothetical protein SISNIDRAFT_487471 [Sistotremastrum niveocremeum HHB9708]
MSTTSSSSFNSTSASSASSFETSLKRIAVAKHALFELATRYLRFGITDFARFCTYYFEFSSLAAECFETSDIEPRTVTRQWYMAFSLADKGALRRHLRNASFHEDIYNPLSQSRFIRAGKQRFPIHPSHAPQYYQPYEIPTRPVRLSLTAKTAVAQRVNADVITLLERDRITHDDVLLLRNSLIQHFHLDEVHDLEFRAHQTRRDTILRQAAVRRAARDVERIREVEAEQSSVEEESEEESSEKESSSGGSGTESEEEGSDHGMVVTEQDIFGTNDEDDLYVNAPTANASTSNPGPSSSSDEEILPVYAPRTRIYKPAEFWRQHIIDEDHPPLQTPLPPPSYQHDAYSVSLDEPPREEAERAATEDRVIFETPNGKFELVAGQCFVDDFMVRRLE